MDLAYESPIEEFFRKYKDWFFPNDKYSEEDMKKACSEYYENLCRELEYWEKETHRLDCSDLWELLVMPDDADKQAWQNLIDRLSYEQYNAIRKEADYHEYVSSFVNYTLNKNKFTNPRSEQLLSVFIPSLGIKKEDTALKKVGKIVGFHAHWAKDIFTAQKRCCLSNCEKLLEEIGYFDKDK